MSDEGKDQYYFDMRVAGRTYVGKSFPDKFDEGVTKRIAHRITSGDEQDEFVRVKGDTILQVAKGARCQLKAIVVEDPRRVEKLILQRFYSDGRPHQDVFSFRGADIHNLVKFIQQLKEEPFSDGQGVKINDTDLRQIEFTPAQIEQIVQDHRPLIMAAIQHGVTEAEILALSLKKNQLDEFYRLLTDEAYFDLQCTDQGKKPERLWQDFFERNTWIFGYGLAYVINAPLEGKKLEQIVTGGSVFSRGKRADAVMKTRAAISALCLGEIKTHRTPLLAPGQPRPDTWAPSLEFTQAIAQSQRTVQHAIKQVHSRAVIMDDGGAPTGEEIFLYTPKSFLVIGRQEEFLEEHGINESRYSSFEMYRKHLVAPEVITFDELYERARYIVELAECDGLEP